MKNQAKYALGFSIAYIAVKNITYIIGLENTEKGKLIGLISLLFVLLVIFLTLKESRKTNPNPPFLEEVKTGAKAGGIYTLICAIYVTLHYSFVSPSMNQKLTEIVQHQVTMLNTEFFDQNKVVMVNKDYEIKINPEFENQAYEQRFIDEKISLLKTAIDQAKLVYRPMIYGTITLVGLMVLTFFYSFGVTVLLRKLHSL